MSQNSASPPIEAMNAIFSLSGDQPNSLSLASFGRPVLSSCGFPLYLPLRGGYVCLLAPKGQANIGIL